LKLLAKRFKLRITELIIEIQVCNLRTLSIGGGIVGKEKEEEEKIAEI